MSFTRKHVAMLLGYRGPSVLSTYETGERLPSLVNGLRLAIIFRIPVEFLFPALYDALKTQIRAEEERLAAPIQQALF